MSPPSWVGAAVVIIYLLATPLYIPLWRCKAHRNTSDIRFWHFIGHLAGAAFIAHEYLLAAAVTTPVTYTVQCASWIFIYAATTRKMWIVLKHSPKFNNLVAKIFMAALVGGLLACGCATVTYSAQHDNYKVSSTTFAYASLGFAAALFLAAATYFGSSSIDDGFHSHVRQIFSRHTIAALYTDLSVVCLVPAYTLAKEIVSIRAADGSKQLNQDATIAALFCESALFTTQFALHVFVTWEQAKENDNNGGSRANGGISSSAVMSAALTDAFVPRYGSLANTEDGNSPTAGELEYQPPTGSGSNDQNNNNNNHHHNHNQSSSSKSRKAMALNSGTLNRNTNNNNNRDEEDVESPMIVTDGEARNDMRREHVRLRKPFLSALNSSSPFSKNFYISKFSYALGATGGGGGANSGAGGIGGLTSYEEFKEILFKECSSGRADIAQQLVEARDPSLRGWTLIHFAAAKRNTEALRVIFHELYSTGSDRVAFSVVDSYGLTPLHLAVLGIDAGSSSNNMGGATTNNTSNANTSSNQQRTGSLSPQERNNNNNTSGTNSNSNSTNNTAPSSPHSKNVSASNLAAAVTASPNSSNPPPNTQNLSAYDIEINNACAAIRFMCSVVRVDAGAVAGHGDGRNALHLAVMRNADIRIIKELVAANVSSTTLAERYSVAAATDGGTATSGIINHADGSGGNGGGAGGGGNSNSAAAAAAALRNRRLQQQQQQDDTASKAPDTLPTNPWFHHFASQLDYNGKSALVLAIEMNNWEAVSVMLSSATGGGVGVGGGLPPVSSVNALNSSSSGVVGLRSHQQHPSALRCGRCRNASLLQIALTTGSSVVVKGMLKGACEFAEAQHQTRFNLLQYSAISQQQQRAAANNNNNNINNNNESNNSSHSASGNPPNMESSGAAGVVVVGLENSTIDRPSIASSSGDVSPPSPNLTTSRNNENLITYTTNSPSNNNNNNSSNKAGLFPGLPLGKNNNNNNNNNSFPRIYAAQNQTVNNNNNQQVVNTFPCWARAIHKSLKETTWSSRSKGLNVFHCAAMGDTCPSILIDLVRCLAPPVIIYGAQYDHRNNNNSNSNNNLKKQPQPQNQQSITSSPKDPSPLDVALHNKLYQIELWRDLTRTGICSVSNASNIHQPQNNNSPFGRTQMNSNSAPNLFSSGSSGAPNNNNNTSGSRNVSSSAKTQNNNNNNSGEANNLATPPSTSISPPGSNCRPVAGDGIPAVAWMHLWENRHSRIGLHSCAKHLTELTKSSAEFIKKHEGGKLVQRIGNAMLTAGAAQEIIDAAEKFKVRELGLFVSEWHQLEGKNSAVGQTPAKAEDVLAWSILNRVYLQQNYAFLFNNNNNSDCGLCGDVHHHQQPNNNHHHHTVTSTSQLQTPISSSLNVIGVVPIVSNLNNNNNNNSTVAATTLSVNAASGVNGAFMLNPSDAISLSCNNNNIRSPPFMFSNSNVLNNNDSPSNVNVAAVKTARASSLPPMLPPASLANNNNNNNNNNTSLSGVVSPVNNNSTLSMSSPSASAVMMLSRENSSQMQIQHYVSLLTPERKKVLERLTNVMALADVLDFVVGAKIGQVGPSPTYSGNLPTGSPQAFSSNNNNNNFGGATPKNISVPSFVRSMSQPNLSGGLNENENNNTGKENGDNSQSMEEQQQQQLSHEQILENYILQQQEHMENLLEIRKMLHTRAAYYGIRNAEVDPLFTPMEVAFHRCHFAMFLALTVLDETIEHLLSEKRNEIQVKVDDFEKEFQASSRQDQTKIEGDNKNNNRNSLNADNDDDDDDHQPTVTDEDDDDDDDDEDIHRKDKPRNLKIKICHESSVVRQKLQALDVLISISASGGGERGAVPYSSPHLASASLRESSLLSIEPLREEILERLAK